MEAMSITAENMASTSSSQSVVNVQKTVSIARLDSSNLLSLVQPITFDSTPDNDLYLMELNTELMADLAEGKSLSFVGGIDEPAMFCSKTASFEVKEAETSNSLLVFPTLSYPANGAKSLADISTEDIVPQTVSGIFHTYFELRKCKPKLQKLQHILERCTFQGREYEEDGVEKFTFSDLLSCVQASEEEIKAGILKLHACEIDGYIRLLDFDYKFRVLSQILDTVYSESFSHDKVPKETVINLLDDLEPRIVLENIFSWFATETSEIDNNGKTLYSLKEPEICRAFAIVLLRNAEKFNYREFLDSWQKSVPEGMKAELSHLEGIALIDLTARPEVISYFPAIDLPDNINERFKKLFKVKAKWTDSEIMPYLRDLEPCVKAAGSLLLKYTRAFVLQGVRMYSSKW